MRIFSRYEIYRPRIPVGTTPTIKTCLYTGTPGSPMPLRGSQLQTLTLTIADTQTALVVNGCYRINVLNTGRGTVDESGITLMAWLPGDTALLDPDGPQVVRRSQILDWTYLTASGALAVWRHETIVTIASLTEDGVI